MMEYKGFRDLTVYQKSYKLAIEITNLTKAFPKDEKYVLVDQIRRSSRAIPAILAEAWAKRIYPKSFVSKIIDAYGEELDPPAGGWLDMALDYKYINKEVHDAFLEKYSEIRKMLIYMSNNPHKFCK